MRLRKPILLSVSLLCALTIPITADDGTAAVKTLQHFHAAMERGDGVAAASFLGSTFFMGDERSTGSAERIAAHMFLSGERVRTWPSAYLKEVGPYRNTAKVVSISVRRDAAVVITRDTGSNAFRSWKDEEVTWLLGSTSDGWRLVGMIIRDIQLPKPGREQ